MSRLRTLMALALVLLSLAGGAAETINLNTADAEMLAAGLDGIGPAKAQAIVEYRAKHGPFKTVDDLLLVRGIGESTLQKNRDRVTAATP
ncbi:MAG: helix-hairpin-helix domain-containing protein [Gammaproteobacteria bacterium]|nr:helix-hairpin-helix domain-containing protein [Gammaproteobacteria bacterium]MCP5200617.1 helix-hairpin-helix domain-containing protein [Gammaproteobacteria bacterium]